MLWATENKDVSSANNLDMLLISFDKLLMYIKNSKFSNMDSYGTPARVSTQYEQWPFKTTFCFLSLRKPCKIFIISLQIPFWRRLKISPSCNTLSKALEIPKTIPQTLRPISRALNISWLIEGCWLMQKFLGLNPDWFAAKRLFSENKSNLVS